MEIKTDCKYNKKLLAHDIKITVDGDDYLYRIPDRVNEQFKGDIDKLVLELINKAIEDHGVKNAKA